MKKGAFTFVLHSHLPYCRKAGSWPHGEEWLHEAISETYIPLLNVLYDLAENDYRFKLTIGITPVLAEQLADRHIMEHFQLFVIDKIDRATHDIKRFSDNNQSHLSYLAGFYKYYYESVLKSWNTRFNKNITGSFKHLQDNGYIEILTSAATHGYLPLLERDSSIYGQLKTGILSYERHFGKRPRSIWLPECAYRPGYYHSYKGKEYVKPGIESFLADLNIKLFFSETHTIEGGEPVGKTTGDIVGPYGNIPKRYVVPITGYQEPTMKTTFLPYWVQTADVAVLGRNNRTGMQVWSADWGYPGDFDYREFHKKDGLSGLQYWRVTGPKLDLAFKDLYHPDWAANKVNEHSSNYAGLVDELISDFACRYNKYGIIAATYDTELFGHWWFEGISWLGEVLKRLSVSETVDLTTATEYIYNYPPEDVLALHEGSWGQAGNHFTWMNSDTEWMWPIIHKAEYHMEELVMLHPDATGNTATILNQAARELLLLQSSDWPFLVTTGQARAYAIERFSEHVERFHKLYELAKSNRIDHSAMSYCNELYELDNIFPHIDYKSFAAREPL